METVNISLDQVQVDERYNFKTVYELTDYLDTSGDSPLGQGNQECKYYEPDQFSQIVEGKNVSLSSFHLNCRSLSSNWDAFHHLLCDLHNKNFSFDLIGVSEVFRADRDPRVVLSGYHNILTRCRNDDGRGGVGLFVKDSINFRVREDLSVFIPHVYESLFIEVELGSHKKLIAGVVYRPNTLPRANVDLFPLLSLTSWKLLILRGSLV